MAANIAPSAFVLLPAEVRLRVYDYMFINTGPLHLCNHAAVAYHPMNVSINRGLSQWIALLRVNHLIHEEASTVLYTKNRFYFTNRPAAHCDENCVQFNPYHHLIQKVMLDHSLDWQDWPAGSIHLGNNGQVYSPLIDVVKLLPNLRDIDVKFTHRQRHIERNAIILILIPFMEPLMHWVPRKCPRIEVNNPDAYRQILADYAPPLPLDSNYTYQLHFVLTDGSAVMTRGLRRFRNPWPTRFSIILHELL
ncbi:hypothetical protein BT63DRAFT_465253 [Microthyrium microscopicum]|uniref:F-box domain-containing protein n=1 Tax=Microthyrium microscopicum TaxID=703497 RepID=A0A6A6TUU6_9PEZI|nr:hypothetical protein BT63DRAFT_465253 [Microthyrium microscopicum]